MERMDELTLVGLSEDKTAVVLSDADGTRFRLDVDGLLRRALASARPAPTRVEPAAAAATTEPALRPREIQRRVRAGESPAEIAESAGMSLSKVLPFALPVLDERAHVAERALHAVVRGARTGTLNQTLGIVSTAQLRTEGLRPEDASWEAWRREDGRWSLRATYLLNGREHHANFAYDVTGRYVVAEDPASRWLSGTVEADAEPTAESNGRALRAVADLTEITVAADADWIVTQVTERLTTERVPDHDDAETQAADHETPIAAPRGARRARTSVPSWDEIMFGSVER